MNVLLKIMAIAIFVFLDLHIMMILNHFLLLNNKRKCVWHWKLSHTNDRFRNSIGKLILWKWSCIGWIARGYNCWKLNLCGFQIHDIVHVHQEQKRFNAYFNICIGTSSAFLFNDWFVIITSRYPTHIRTYLFYLEYPLWIKYSVIISKNVRVEKDLSREIFKNIVN